MVGAIPGPEESRERLAISQAVMDSIREAKTRPPKRAMEIIESILGGDSAAGRAIDGSATSSCRPLNPKSGGSHGKWIQGRPWKSCARTPATWNG
jgi:hypothetical protein